MKELSFENELAARLPTLLAELYHDAHNASEDLDRHQNAYYLFEVAIKLLGSAAIVAYAERGNPEPDLVEKLKKLTRATTGEWWGFVQLLVPRLAKLGDEGFREVNQRLFRGATTDLPHAAGLYVQLKKRYAKVAAGQSPDDSSPGQLPKMAGPRSTVRLHELFTLLVKYRNKEMGHAALGKHRPGFYDVWGRAILTGMTDVLSKVDFLAGQRMVYVSGVNQDASGNWVVERYTLASATPRLERKEVQAANSADLPLRSRVYLERHSAVLAGAADPIAAKDFVSLHPLVIFDATTKRTLLLDVRAHDNRTGYLCYRSSEHFERPDLGQERRELLARVLGMAVDEEQAERWAAAAHAEAQAAATESQDDVPIDEIETPEHELPTIGDYVLQCILGEGAMGRVYRAWDPALHRTVALKTLLRPGNTKREARFAREIRALGRVKHPHLAEILTSGAEGDQYYFAMDLIEGTNLEVLSDTLHSGIKSVTQVDQQCWQSSMQSACDETRAKEQPLGDATIARPPVIRVPGDAVRPLREGSYVRQVVELMAQVADAAHALHSAGIVHRDIKPSNVIVDPTGTRATLVDLGLAQLAEEGNGGLTKTRDMVGTLQYASPEQVLAVGRVDHRSDIYSLGATMWELLTLRRLYGANKDMADLELAKRIQYSEPEALRRYHTGISRDLEAIVSKCLEKDANRRYQTAQALVEDLHRYLAGETVTARPVSDFVRFTRLCRRNPLVSGLAVATMIVALAGSVFSTALWLSARAQWIRAEDEKTRATAERVRAEDEKSHAEEEKQRADLARDDATREKQSAEEARDSAEHHKKVAETALVDAKRQEEIATTNASEAKVAREHAEEGQRAANRSLYMAQIRLAQAMLRDGEVRAAWDLLVQSSRDRGALPVAGRAERFAPLITAQDQGWEWHYLTSLCRAQLNVLQCPAVVTRVAFHPNGGSCFTGDAEGNVIQWSTVTGAQLRAFPHSGTGEVALGFALRWNDNKLTVIKRPWLEEKNGGEPIPEINDEVVSLGDANGRMQLVSQLDYARICELVQGPADSRLTLDVQRPGQAQIKHFVVTRKLDRSFGHSQGITGLAVSADGTTLATTSFDKSIRFWGVDGYPLPSLLGGGANIPKPIQAVIFHPDSKHIGFAYDNMVLYGDVKFDGMKFDVSWASGDRHTDVVNFVEFMPARSWLCSASNDGTMKFWDVEERALKKTYAFDGKEIKPADPQAPGAADNQNGPERQGTNDRSDSAPKSRTDPIVHLTASEDGKRIAAVNRNGKVRCWNIDDGGNLSIAFSSSQSMFSHVAFRPSDGVLAATAYDGTIRLFARDGREVRTLPIHSGPVDDVAFSPDGRLVASASRDRSFSLRRLDANEQNQRVVRRSARDIRLTPDGRRMILGTGKIIEVRNGASGRLEQEYRDMAETFALEASCRHLVTAKKNEVLRIDLDTRETEHCFSVPTGNVLAVAVSEDGTRIAASNDDQSRQRVWVYDVVNRAILYELTPSGDRAQWLAFGPDGQTLANRATSWGFDVWRWENEVEHAIVEDETVPYCGLFRRETGELVLGRMDGAVSFWSIEQDDDGHLRVERRRRPLSGHRSFVMDIDFSRDGMRMGTSGADGTVRIWDPNSGQELLSLRHAVDAAVSCVAFGGGARDWRVVSGTDDNIRFWEAAVLAPEADREDPAINLVRGRICGNLYNWEQAADDYSAAINRGADDAYVWQYRGMAQAHLRRFQAAERDLTEAARRLPQDPSVWTSRHLNYAESGSAAAAERDYERAVECVGTALTIPPDTWPGQMPLDRDAAEYFGWDSLIDDLTRTIDRGGAPWYIFRARGLARLDLGYCTDACRDFEQALRLKPDDWQAWRALARGHWDRSFKDGETEYQKRQSSIEALDQAIKLKPDSWELWYLRGICWYLVEQHDKATADLNEAVRLRPQGWAIWAEVGTARLAARKFGEAITALIQARQQGAANDSTVNSRLISAQLAGGDLAGYRVLCEELVRGNTETQSPELANSLAWTCVVGPGALADPMQPVRFARVAVAGKPDTYTYINTLGVALYRAGLFDESLERLNEAVKLHRSGGGPDDFFFLALAHHRLGHAADARTWYDKGVRWVSERVTTARESNGTIEYTTIDQLGHEIMRREVEQQLEIKPAS